jgi:N-methylhydantoinase B
LDGVYVYSSFSSVAGAGKCRGSPGIVWEAVNEGGDCTNTGGPMSGFSTQGPGQQGGQPTPLNKVYIIRDGVRTQIKDPRQPIHFKHGDDFVIMSGGAGVGNPAERDPEEVLMDVKNELVSIQMAKDVYKVVIDPEKMQVLKKETLALRKSEGIHQADELYSRFRGSLFCRSKASQVGTGSR